MKFDSTQATSLRFALGDMLTGIVCLALGIIIVMMAGTFRPMLPGTLIGPGLFPTLCGAGFTGVGAMMLVKAALAALNPARPEGGTAFIESWKHDHPLPLVIPTLLIATLILMPAIGFVTSTACVALILMKACGSRWIPAITLGIVFSLAAYFIFTRMMKVPLPVGHIFGG